MNSNLREKGVVSDNAERSIISFKISQLASIMLNAEGIGASPFPSHGVDPSELLLCELPSNEAFVPCSEIVTKTNIYTAAHELAVIVAGFRIVTGSPRVSESFVERVLARLAKLELKAPQGDRDDYRVAWITVLKASEGHPDPWRQAFWQYHGEQPETLIPFFEARAYLHSIYEGNYAVLDPHLPLRFVRGWEEMYLQILEKLPVKKPVVSVGTLAKKAGAA